ncbi:MAG: ABC1 kinase family protein [Acidimicrobiales bacterium]
MTDLLGRSRWVEVRPGLREATSEWMAALPDTRVDLAGRAEVIAKPSLRWRSLRAVLITLLRFLRLAVPTAVAGLGRRVTRSLRRVVTRKPASSPEGQSSATTRTAVRRAEQIVRAGGPAYVKLGQFVATARGILPNEWTEAFEWCRDEVPPLPPGTAERIVSEAFRRPVSDVFASFDTTPFAAASIAQVHSATLADGSDVVVKIRRPGLREQFEADIRAMALFGAIAERISPAARMGNPTGFVQLFAQLVLEELDFRLEALNMVEIALASEESEHDYVTIPRPIPGMVRSDVLVMERVPGVRYTDALEAYPDAVDGDRLLRLATQGVLEHALVYGLFHGDLHAGNVLIAPDGGFSLVDFGIAGRVNAEERAALVRLTVGFAQMDVRLQLTAMQEFGAIPPDADVEALVPELESHSARLEELANAGHASISFDQLAEEVGTLIRVLLAHGFRVPKELVLFSKNMLYLNGFAAALAPNANLLAEIEPVFTYFYTKYPQEMATIAMGLLSAPNIMAKAQMLGGFDLRPSAEAAKQ